MVRYSREEEARERLTQEAWDATPTMAEAKSSGRGGGGAKGGKAAADEEDEEDDEEDFAKGAK